MICAVFFGAKPFDTFFWSGTIGTLILLVAYVLATIGCIKLIWIDKKMPQVPHVGDRDPGRGAGGDRLHALPQRAARTPTPGRRGGSRWWRSAGSLVVAVVAFAVPGFAQRLAGGLRELDDGDAEGEPEVVGG